MEIEKLTNHAREVLEALPSGRGALSIIDRLTAECERLRAAQEAAERESAYWASTAAAFADQLLHLSETVDAFEKARKRLTSRGGVA